MKVCEGDYGRPPAENLVPEGSLTQREGGVAAASETLRARRGLRYRCWWDANDRDAQSSRLLLPMASSSKIRLCAPAAPALLKIVLPKRGAEQADSDEEEWEESG